MSSGSAERQHQEDVVLVEQAASPYGVALGRVIEREAAERGIGLSDLGEAARLSPRRFHRSMVLGVWTLQQVEAIAHRLGVRPSVLFAQVDEAADLTEASELLRAERDENTCREPMAPTEEHSLYEALLDIEREAARERMSDGGKGVKVSHPSTESGATSDPQAPESTIPQGEPVSRASAMTTPSLVAWVGG